jgi:pimeloyl-ACP methyl ester carboxylesterase
VRWSVLPTRLVRSLVAGTPRAGVPELVVVPGLGALGYLLPTVRACAAWTRVHLLDVPGFGHRATADLPADLASVAATVAAWLQEAAPARVLLVGHSTGAQSALRAAVAAPDRVAQLVLAGATFAPHARRLPPLVRDIARTLVHERAGELPAVLPYYLRGARGLPVLMRTALADRPEDAMGDVRAPVLVLRGTHDHLCPADWAQTLAARAADARGVVLPGAHNVPYTDPRGMSRALQATVAAAAGSASSSPPDRAAGAADVSPQRS